MPTGKVKWFNNVKGWGFIIPEEAGKDTKDIFVHFKSIKKRGYKKLKEGQSVTYTMELRQNGLHAVEVVPHDMPKKLSKEVINV